MTDRKRKPYDPTIPPGFASKEAFLCSCRGGRRVQSPFLSLLDFPGGAAVAELLVEGGSVEVEFDVIGRELRLVGMWEEYSALWFDAFAAAIHQRERPAAAGPAQQGETS